MPQQLFQHTFPNGLTLLGEQMEHVRSASMNLMIPAGYAYEPADKLGLCGIFADVLTRGAGEYDSKQLAAAFDNLGADHSESAGTFNVVFSAGTLARNLPSVLRLYADVVLRPWLPDDEVEPARDISLQELKGLDDSPPDLCFLELKRRFYPDPYSRNQYGTAETLMAVTPADVKKFHADRFHPNGAILSVAGNIAWEPLKELVGSVFADWKGKASDVTPGAVPPTGYTHIPKDTNQTQITLAYPTAPFRSPDYYLARAAVNVLDGGMSSRLFTEVREKRGLCYAVSASHDQVKEKAAVVCYAGTETARAQQTLEVIVQVLRGLRDGVTDEELDRVKAGLKTSLIMQQESTSARAGAMAAEWFHLGRVRPLDEVQAAIDGTTPAKLMDFLDRYPAHGFTVVTLGAEPLTVPE
ncbi:MAG: insulinase family protein [Fimbriiglobus sp.]|nr:insulinase family protein [Fimbriiglobus sp.]